MELSTTAFPRVHVTSPGDKVVGSSNFCVVVKFNGLEVVSSFIISGGEDEAVVDVLVTGSVIGLLYDAVVVVVDIVDAVVVLGRFDGLRVTNVDLTVEVLIVGFDGVVNEGFMLVVFSLDSTEKVVTSMSSAEIVVGSTFTIKSVGVGFGRGAFVTCT